MKENKNRMIDRQIKVTIPLLNLVSLANHDMRKTWCCVCGVYGGMFRKTNGDLDSLRFSYITES